MEFVTRFSPRVRRGVKFEKPSRTKQSFAAETDINQIMARYQKTGVLSVDPLVAARAANPLYGDVSGLPSYQEMRNRIVQADEAFAALPAALRKRFGNDPAKMLEFVCDADNRAEAVKLGLIAPAVPATEDGAKAGEPAGAPSNAPEPVPPKA